MTNDKYLRRRAWVPALVVFAYFALWSVAALLVEGMAFTAMNAITVVVLYLLFTTAFNISVVSRLEALERRLGEVPAEGAKAPPPEHHG